MSRWWRAYDEAVDDPKLQRLGPKLGWAWFNLMCISSKNNGCLPLIGDIAFKLRMTEQQAAAMLTELVSAGLFDRQEDGRFAPHNWNARQFKSDVSTHRVKRFRERERNVPTTVSETPPETETETETEKSRGARKRGARLPEDWNPLMPDTAEAERKLGSSGAIEELAKFRDYWKAQPGQRGTKLDWDATFRNWIRNAKGPPSSNGKRTIHQATDDLLAKIRGFDEQPPGIRDNTRETPIRLLPSR